MGKVSCVEYLVRQLKGLDAEHLKRALIEQAETREAKHDETLRKIGFQATAYQLEQREKKQDELGCTGESCQFYGKCSWSGGCPTSNRLAE